MSTRTDIFDETDETVEVAQTDVEATEAPAPADDKAAKQAAADAEHEPKVEAFKAIVREVVEAADETTGSVSEAGLERAAEAYRNVTGGIKYKNQAKEFVDEGMKSHLSANEYTIAVAYNEVSEKLRVTKAAPKATAPKIDPKEAYADRVAALQVALDYLESNVPEEAEGYELPSTDAAYNQAAEYIGWTEEDAETRGEAPELTPVAQAAVKVIQGRGLGGRKASGGGIARAPFTGTRRDVGAHIVNAFADKASGEFMTVSEIVKTRSDEYGDDAPSSGAVSARLFPKGDASKCNVEGVIPGVNSDGVKGATKA